MMEGPGANSEEKHEPASYIDTALVDSLKALDPEGPIREADIAPYSRQVRFVPLSEIAPSKGFLAHAFHEPLRMRRQRCEVSNANGVTPKSPFVSQRNYPDCHRMLGSAGSRFRQH